MRTKVFLLVIKCGVFTNTSFEISVSSNFLFDPNPLFDSSSGGGDSDDGESILIYWNSFLI